MNNQQKLELPLNTEPHSAYNDKIVIKSKSTVAIVILILLLIGAISACIYLFVKRRKPCSPCSMQKYIEIPQTSCKNGYLFTLNGVTRSTQNLYPNGTKDRVDYCQNACNSTPGCNAFEVQPNVCWTFSQTYNNLNYTGHCSKDADSSFYQKVAPEDQTSIFNESKNTTVNTSGITPLNRPSPAQCANECMKTTKCTGFVFAPRDGCYLLPNAASMSTSTKENTSLYVSKI